VIGAHLQAHDDPYVAAAHYWVDMNQRLLAFRRAAPERTHLLRYDALIADPEREIARALAFLGEPFEPAVLDFNRFAHDAGLEDHVVSSTWRVEDERGKHRALPSALQARLWTVVRETMLALGYEDRSYPSG
jgi:hypothetical protein